MEVNSWEQIGSRRERIARSELKRLRVLLKASEDEFERECKEKWNKKREG